MAFGIVRTVSASSRLRVAGLRMTVTITPLTVGIVPKAGLTLIAASSVRIGTAFTCAADGIAKIVQRTVAVTVARFTALGSESVGSRGTLIAPLADNIGLTFTGSAVGLTYRRFRAHRVAVTRLGAVIHADRQGLIEFEAGFGNLTSHNGVKVFIATISLVLLSHSFADCPVKQFNVLHNGDQND